MQIDIITIFPDFFRGPLDYGIIRRAREAGLVKIEIRDLRAFTRDRHRTVDDRPFGGGAGMVLKPEPLFECVEALKLAPHEEHAAAKRSVVLLSAQGKRGGAPHAGRLRPVGRGRGQQRPPSGLAGSPEPKQGQRGDVGTTVADADQQVGLPGKLKQLGVGQAVHCLLPGYLSGHLP